MHGDGGRYQAAGLATGTTFMLVSGAQFVAHQRDPSTAVVHNLQTGAEQSVPHEAFFDCTTFSPDGRFATTPKSDGLQLLQIATGQT